MGAVVFFAFILFVMGGVTAYMGDRLGSYIGKKRHSTFGLRPRHTAMLWTVVSGGVIAVGTLGLFLALNQTFSTALVRGPQLLKTNRLLDRQNRSLTRRNLATEQQAQQDSRRAVQAQAQVKDAQAQAAQARATLSQVRTALGQAHRTLVQSQKTLAQRQAALTGAKAHLLAAQNDLGSTSAELARARQQVRVARLGVKDAQKQYQLAGIQVLQANKNVLALGIEQDTLHTENTALVRRNQAQQSLLLASQGHPLVFRRGEELGRTVVSAGQPSASLRRELAVFLDQVELAARQRGAGDQDNSPAVVIPAPGEGADNGVEAREAVLDALSESIAAQGGGQPSVVVVATARYNTFKGESVKLDLKPYANDLVFPKGTVIAIEAVDGTQPDDVILKRLQAFLTGQVRAVARGRGIIPVTDPQSGEPLVGQPIDTPTALALVKQIQQAGSDAHVIAAAAADTYSADLLRLDLRVTPAPALPRASAARQ